MAYDIRKVDIWVGDMPDRPGALAEKLEAVAAAGAHLECVIARRAWNHPNRSVVFLAPLRGAAQARAARAAGLEKALGMNSLRVEGPDRPGLVAKLTRAVGDAGINFRGVTAEMIGRRAVIYLAFASETDANHARRVIKKMLR